MLAFPEVSPTSSEWRQTLPSPQPLFRSQRKTMPVTQCGSHRRALSTVSRGVVWPSSGAYGTSAARPSMAGDRAYLHTTSRVNSDACTSQSLCGRRGRQRTRQNTKPASSTDSRDDHRVAAHRDQGASAIGAHRDRRQGRARAHASTSPYWSPPAPPRNTSSCRAGHRGARGGAAVDVASFACRRLARFAYGSHAHCVHPRRVGMVPSRHLVDHREDARSHEPACDRNDCSVRHGVFASRRVPVSSGLRAVLNHRGEITP